MYTVSNFGVNLNYFTYGIEYIWKDYPRYAVTDIDLIKLEWNCINTFLHQFLSLHILVIDSINKLIDEFLSLSPFPNTNTCTHTDCPQTVSGWWLRLKIPRVRGLEKRVLPQFIGTRSHTTWEVDIGGCQLLLVTNVVKLPGSDTTF